MVSCGSFFGIKNKYFEIQLERFEAWQSYFNFQLDLTRNMDHAGFMFQLEFFGLFFNFNIYDSRHWDYENRRWATYEE